MWQTLRQDYGIIVPRYQYYLQNHILSYLDSHSSCENEHDVKSLMYVIILPIKTE